MDEKEEGEKETLSYNNLKDVVKGLNSDGYDLQMILDDCYKLGEQYNKDTNPENYSRTNELNYIASYITETYAHIGKKDEE